MHFFFFPPSGEWLIDQTSKRRVTFLLKSGFIQYLFLTTRCCRVSPYIQQSPTHNKQYLKSWLFNSLQHQYIVGCVGNFRAVKNSAGVIVIVTVRQASGLMLSRGFLFLTLRSLGICFQRQIFKWKKKQMKQYKKKDSWLYKTFKI